MDGHPQDPREGLSRLFGDAVGESGSPASPFGEPPTAGGSESRLRTAITRLRILRSQAGSDGLTPAATRQLLDEVVQALEAIGDLIPRGPAADHLEDPEP